MSGIIQDYVSTIQADFQLVAHYIKKGCPKKSAEKREKIIHAAVRVILVPLAVVVAVKFVASVAVGSLTSVIYLIGVGVLLHDIYQGCKNKSPSYFDLVTHQVKESVAYFWGDKKLFKNVPSHRLTKNMIIKPIADVILYKFFPHLN